MRGYILIGSNLGDRVGTIDKALDALGQHGVTVIARSSLYETAPVGPVADQPAYLNAAAEIETELTPLALLDALKAGERSRGRITDVNDPAYVPQGPRTIDLDIGLVDGVTHDDGRLQVPHPRLTERRFALIPLLELDFGLELPDGRKLADALAELPVADQQVSYFAREGASGP